MAAPQLELFAPPSPAAAEAAPARPEPPPDFVERIRAELHGVLAAVRAASALPWPDLTRATLAELRFRSIAGWLPEAEAAALREAFESELDRLYQLEDERSDGA
jgi:hypothetical protein